MSANPDKEYTIQRLSIDNIDDVTQLHLAVYGKMPPEDYFRKKYDTAYTGAQYVGYIAYSKQHVPIAYYGVIPCFIKYNEQVVLAAQSADTMTNPNYRFKGLFVELSNITFQLCRDEGLLLIFGFPNQNSYHGAVTKLGWQMTEMLQYFTIPAAKVSLEGIAARHPVFKSIYKWYTGLILKKYGLPIKGIQASPLAEGYGGVDRSAAYLNYKSYSETRVIKIDDATLWIKINNGLTIGDILIGGANFENVMRKVVSLARKLGLKQIVFHASPHSQLYALFAKQYQPAASFPVLFQDFGAGIPNDQIKFTFADIDIF